MSFEDFYREKIDKEEVRNALSISPKERVCLNCRYYTCIAIRMIYEPDWFMRFFFHRKATKKSSYVGDCHLNPEKIRKLSDSYCSKIDVV